MHHLQAKEPFKAIVDYHVRLVLSTHDFGVIADKQCFNISVRQVENVLGMHH